MVGARWLAAALTFDAPESVRAEQQALVRAKKFIALADDLAL